MAIIRAYTTIEQSRKLAEILPLESADMYYIDSDTNKIIIGRWKDEMHDEDDIPCYSLAALLNIIPQEIFYGEYIINITEGCDNRWVLTYDHYGNRNHSYYGLSTGADNPVDACVAMIEKLHKLNLL